MEPLGVTGTMYRISNTCILSVMGGSSLTIYLFFFLFNFFYCIYFKFFYCTELILSRFVYLEETYFGEEDIVCSHSLNQDTGDSIAVVE